jgi:hypothetical protein
LSKFDVFQLAVQLIQAVDLLLKKAAQNLLKNKNWIAWQQKIWHKFITIRITGCERI